MSFSTFFRSQPARSQSDIALENGPVDGSSAVLEVTDEGPDHHAATITTDDTTVQSILRQEMLSISTDDSLNDKQKALLMQSLMTRNYTSMSHKEVQAAIQDVGHPLSPMDLAKTYHDVNANILGCSHYRRNCKLQSVLPLSATSTHTDSSLDVPHAMPGRPAGFVTMRHEQTMNWSAQQPRTCFVCSATLGSQLRSSAQTQIVPGAWLRITAASANYGTTILINTYTTVSIAGYVA